MSSIKPPLGFGFQKASFLKTIKQNHLIKQAITQEWAEQLHNREMFGQQTHGLLHRADAIDSSLFGLRVGKIETVWGTSATAISDILQKFFTKKYYRYYLFRISHTAFPWIHALQSKGAITLDTAVEMNRLIDSKTAFSVDPQVVEAQKGDTSAITKIAQSFNQGRFFSDPDFKQHGTTLFQQWIKNSLNGEAAEKFYILKDNNQIQGFLTIKTEVLAGLKILVIPLVAKSLDSDLPGVANRLLSTVLHFAQQQDYQAAYISTQGTNIPAQRAYIKAGFKPFHTETTLRLIAKRPS